MIRLDTLAEDVILVIASQLDRKDSQHLRLVCRRLSAVVSPYALSHLAINVHRGNYDQVIEKLDAYVNLTTPGARYVRSLAIYRLFSNQQIGHKEETELRRVIPLIFERLDIRRLQWNTNRWDPQWVPEMIVAGISAHPVRDLTLDFSYGSLETPIALTGVGGIQKLSIKNTKQLDLSFGIEGRDRMFAEIARVIADSHALRELSIEVGYPEVGTLQSPGLHLFLPSAENAGVAPLALKALSLDSVNMESYEQFLPHFRSLESLSSLSSIKDTNIPLPHVWKALQREGIRLKKIRVTTNDIKRELLEYLIFCKDVLTDLVFEASDHENWLQEMFDVVNQNNPHILYTEILPILAPRLEVFAIRANRGNKWCFSAVNATYIGQCKHLKELVIPVVEYDQLHNKHLRDVIERMKATMRSDLHLEILNVHRVLQIS